MRKKLIVLGTLILVLIIGACVGWCYILDNKLPAFSNGGTIHIYEGESIDKVLEDMTRTFQPLHPKSLRRAMAKEKAAERLHPGAYVFKQTNSAIFVARSITRGWQSPVKLTLSGSIRSKEVLASKISSQMMVDSVSVLNALKDSVLLSSFGTTPSKLFEIILPDTYEMYWDWDMEKILKRLRKEYDLFWNKERQAKAKANGLTPEQVSILASIVAEETARKDEFPKVASVYLTRLSKGMKLQACPTICYIYDYKIRRVLYKHLNNPSPYNTYMYAGLPPTPICVPSKEHINAVLNPDSHKYLYFCADSEFNGKNVFSETYSEHLKNAAKYHQALNELQEARAKAAAEAAETNDKQ